MDIQQNIFEMFEVPDPIRIQKAAGLIRRFSGDIRGKSILECGMAKGGIVDAFLKGGAQCFGVDINPRNVSGVLIKQADLNDGIPNFGMSFDVIFAGEVIEHLFNDEKFVDDVHKNLKENGIFVFTVPNLVFGVNRIRMLFGTTPKFAYAQYHYHIYTKKVIENILERHGFLVKKIISSHVLFSTRKYKIGKIFEILGNIFPTFGAHLIVCARKK